MRMLGKPHRLKAPFLAGLGKVIWAHSIICGEDSDSEFHGASLGNGSEQEPQFGGAGATNRSACTTTDTGSQSGFHLPAWGKRSRISGMIHKGDSPRATRAIFA